MTVLEAHVAISDLIGDSIDITSLGTSLPDGARFTRSMRDVCLTRALYDTYRFALNSVANMPRQQAATLLQTMSPQTTVQARWEITSPTVAYPVGGEYQFDFNTVSAGGTGTKAWRPLYIYGMRLYRDGVYLPIPIKTSIEANGLLNSRNVQIPDTFAVYEANATTSFVSDALYGSPQGFLTIYDRKGDLLENDVVMVDYMPIPVKIDSSTIAGYSRVIEIDAVREPMMLSLAQLYLHINGQDLESIERYLPTMLDLNKG